MVEATATMPGMLFHVLHRTHMNAVQAELTLRGLSDLGSPMILFMLKTRGEAGEIASQRELAQTLRVSSATIATSLKSLERLGYVEKRTDSTDARRNRITITAKGAAAVEQCFEVYRLIDQRMTAGLTEREQEQLQQLHKKMISNLKRPDKVQEGARCPC